MTDALLNTFAEYQAFWAVLTPGQREWVKHKCQWERRTRWAICKEYRPIPELGHE